MNATSIGRSLSIALVAASLMACAVSSEREDTGQANEALRCRTCGAPEPGPDVDDPPVDPGPHQGPTVDCTGKFRRVINGQCYTISWDCPDPDAEGHCGGYTIVGHVYCSVSYPVQRCDAYGRCTCWSS